MTRSAAYRFDQRTKNGECPNEREHRPTPNSSKRPQCKGRVGSGDQPKNRRVIQDLQDRLGACGGPGVVEHRAQVQQQHGYGKNDRTD
jgi:hypothetical protein